jgi:hypothetical protein
MYTKLHIYVDVDTYYYTKMNKHNLIQHQTYLKRKDSFTR